MRSEDGKTRLGTLKLKPLTVAGRGGDAATKEKYEEIIRENAENAFNLKSQITTTILIREQDSAKEKKSDIAPLNRFRQPPW